MLQVGDRVRIEDVVKRTYSVGTIVGINVKSVPMIPQPYVFEEERYAILVEGTGSIVYPKMIDKSITKA